VLSFGIAVYGHGPASNGFAMAIEDINESTTNVTIRNNNIANLRCWTKEYPVMVLRNSSLSGQVLQDARGGVLQFEDAFYNRDMALNRSDGSYTGNVVSDAQIMVAKAINERSFPRNLVSLQTRLNRIPAWIIQWAEGVPVMNRKPKQIPKYRCHGDSMDHFVKGIVGIRIEET
jgi:hypothetical protein